MTRGAKPSRNTRKLENVNATPNYDERSPRFCLHHLIADFDVENLDKDARASLALTLQKRSRLTWAQIKRADRHGMGTELIPADQIKAPIPTQFRDRDRFMVFRYSGTLPMVGVRVEDTFHILWIARTYGDIYNH